MASGGKERRMVFDIRGRRKHVVKVVYAVLAVLMGASLFLVVGPVSLGNLFSGGSSTNAGGKVAIEQAERIERKLAKDPEDADLLLSLTRARISAGTGSQEVNQETGEVTPTVETRQQYAKASEAWSRYLKAVDEPSVGAAQQAASALFALGNISTTPNQILANFGAAADAQRIVAEQQPNLGSVSKYALYSMYAGDFANGEKAGNKAEKLAPTKFAREGFENELEEIKGAIGKFKKEIANNKKANGGGSAELENLLPNSGTGLGE